MAMHGSSRRHRRDEAITFDFAPMVDVVLLLLIFFFLTSRLSSPQHALPLDLPKASNTVQETPSLPLVSLDSSGKLYLNGERIHMNDLSGELKPLLQKSGGLVGLRADQSGNYGQVVAVMDEIKKAGGVRLALGTRHSPKDKKDKTEGAQDKP